MVLSVHFRSLGHIWGETLVLRRHGESWKADARRKNQRNSSSSVNGAFKTDSATSVWYHPCPARHSLHGLGSSISQHHARTFHFFIS